MKDKKWSINSQQELKINMDQYSSGGLFKRSSKNITSSTQEDSNKNPPVEEEQEILQHFGSYTTLHGLHFTLDSTSRLRRVIWICLMLCGLGLFLLQISISLVKLYAREVRISKSVEFAKTLPFPAVTICNQNMMKRSKIAGTIAQDYLDNMDVIKKLFSGKQSKDVPSFDVEKTLQNAGHQIEDMIQYCEFAGTNCSEMYGHEFVSALPSFLHGLCYTFPANSSAVHEIGAGKYQGLVLRLNAEPHEYYGPFSYDGTGFKIAVHEPGIFHDIENKGYDISPGFYTSLRIKRKKIISMPSPYPSKCGSKKLHYFERYTQQSCLAECWGHFLVRECDCRVVGMVGKGIKDFRFCNSTEREMCAKPASIKFRNKSELCGCPLECEAIQYGIQTSMAYYPSETLWESMFPLVERMTGLNASIPEQREKIQMLARKRFASVTIFFEDLSTDVTEEKSNYDISAFGSDVGGNMGLFLGCSLLTVCEFIDLIVLVCLHRWTKKSDKIDERNDQNNPAMVNNYMT